MGLAMAKSGQNRLKDRPILRLLDTYASKKLSPDRLTLLKLFVDFFFFFFSGLIESGVFAMGCSGYLKHFAILEA